MAVSETTEKEQCTMLLNNGRDEHGNVKTVRVNLGSLSREGWDAAKAVAVTNALSSCFSKTLYEVNHIRTSTITEE